MTYLDDTARRILSLVPPELVPEHSDALFLLYAVLARSKGAATRAEDVHDAWTAWMSLNGSQHPSMVPYDQLPHATRIEDEPFVAAIREASTNASPPGPGPR